jgi:hypothetical protein
MHGQQLVKRYTKPGNNLVVRSKAHNNQAPIMDIKTKEPEPPQALATMCRMFLTKK